VVKLHLLVVISIVLASTITPIGTGIKRAHAETDNDLEAEIVALVKDIEYLSSRGVEVGPIVHELDQAVKLVQSGRLGDAEELLSRIRRSVDELKGRAEQIYIVENIYRYGLASLILLIPVLTYLLLPRLYLYTWYRSKRKWVVGGVEK